MKRYVFASVIVLVSFVSISRGQSDAPAAPELPGHIAYIGTDYNVYSINMEDGEVVMLTDDASSSRRYLWPTWAGNNKLAYFCCDASFMTSAGTEVFVSAEGIKAGDLIYTGPEEVMTYAYWSPHDCEVGENCRDLAVLLGRVGGFNVTVLRSSDEDEVTQQVVGTGAPFYYSWSPDGTRMLLQRNNVRFDLYDLESATLERLTGRPGRIQAPAWSPVDDRLLLGILNEGTATTNLSIIHEGEVQVLEAEIRGLVSYSWSPDGRYIAYRTVQRNFIGPVYILDAITGEVVTQSQINGVFSFFWSPDSQRIAYITSAMPRGSFNVRNPGMMPVSVRVQQQQDAPGLAWSVLDVNTGDGWRYDGFLPTSEMIYLLTYFDQFAQSHQIWSPDSTHIVYSEATADGDRWVSILDMTQPDAVPFWIADGIIGIWSYR